MIDELWIRDTADNIKNRSEWQRLPVNVKDAIDLAIDQFALEIRRKINDI